jgi:hypothetical protein
MSVSASTAVSASMTVVSLNDRREQARAPIFGRKCGLLLLFAGLC